MPELRQTDYRLLLDLARETSSERRRELLTRLTDAFIAEPSARTDGEALMFDEIAAAISADLEIQVRIELAHRISRSNVPLNGTARRLAMDVIEVARPILENSSLLATHDLLTIVSKKSEDHQIAVSRRRNLESEVADVLAATGSDNALLSLLENASAQIDPETFEKVTPRVISNPALQPPFVRHRRVPLDLLNEVYFKVSQKLRQDILRRFENVEPRELEQALEVSRKRLATAYGAAPADYEQAALLVEKLQAKCPITSPGLVELLRVGGRTAFAIGLAKLVGVDFGLVDRLVASRDLDALALLCRSAAIERAAFVTFCVLLSAEGNGLSKAQAYGELYEKAPVSAAKRVLSFWKVRSGSPDRNL